MALISCNVGLLMVDHVHFQYNGVLLGVLLASLAALRAGNVLAAGVLFAVLLNMKHLFLVLAPVYFVFILRGWVWGRGWVLRLLAMAAAVIAVFGASLAPIIVKGQGLNLLQRYALTHGDGEGVHACQLAYLNETAAIRSSFGSSHGASMVCGHKLRYSFDMGAGTPAAPSRSLLPGIITGAVLHTHCTCATHVLLPVPSQVHPPVAEWYTATAKFSLCMQAVPLQAGPAARVLGAQRLGAVCWYRPRPGCHVAPHGVAAATEPSVHNVRAGAGEHLSSATPGALPDHTL